MKKFWTVLLCIALACTMFAGCPRQEEVPTEASEPTQAPTEWVVELPEDEKCYDGVKLTFLARWEETDPQAAVLTQAAEVFEATTGAQVEILWPGSETADADILQLSGEELAGYTERVLDLTAMAEDADYSDHSFDALTDQVLSRCGFLGAIPQVPYVSGFYYNRETFTVSGIIQSPQTWEDFLMVCGQLVSGGWEPLTLNSEDAAEMLMLYLTQYLGAEGAQNVAANGGWQEEQAMLACTDLFEFAAAGNVATGAPAAYPAGQNKLALSSAAMCYGTNALCAQVEEETLTDVQWGMFPYPGVGGGEPVIGVDSDVLAVSAGCAEPQAAFDFIMLLVCGEFDQLRTDLVGGIPADPDNKSTVTGAVNALKIVQVIEIPGAEWSEKQMKTILKLWKGSFEENTAFSKAMDALYS